ncbi:alpha kinase/elongation factor 2 kinase [Anaeramoeba flamelloides]|uniref:Alpha kinase/elongation factor 2 kinase n=1 Tax=Anaeramoeba flamelloides TaxID=1746091 RepID=A0AAV7Z9V8_9EUKA|nr:alpha kinase/elongation factor 2 kinase [Anaeramoeba flamelloides]
MDPNQNLRCVICIDFGTARTGAAYTITTINTLSQNWANQEAIRLILDPRDQSYNKVPTIVLFETNEYRLLKQPAVKFGKNAFNYYDRLQSSKWKQLELFQYFKLSLDNIKTNNPSIFSLKGNEYKIIDVLAGLFGFIKNQLVFSMTNSGYGSLLNHCKWVLTIPLIWDKRIIQIMRTAAFEGGLIKSLDSKNIIFEYEPEAVGLFFRETANKTFTKKPFLVIDAGGGTIDISLIKQKFDKNNQPKGFKIMTTPKGGKYGSMFINDEFIKYFEEWINFDDKKDFLDLQNNSYFAKLINTFNMQKESISHNQYTSEDEILLEISQKLIKAILERSKKTFHDLTKEFNEKMRKSNRDQMKWDEDEDTFIITGKQMKMFFKKALAPFVFNLRKIIDLKLFQEEVDLVVCSGGLSNSIIFQNIIRKELQNTSIQVSFSENASCAVILGGIGLV